MSPALLDATILSNFSHVRRPDLVRTAVGERAATTPLVLREIRAGEDLGLLPVCHWGWLTILDPTPEETALAKRWARQLDPGEAECLAVTQTRRCVFLSDDLAARSLAEQRDLRVSGTLGILLELVEREHLTLQRADSLLKIMIRWGYRSPVSSLSDIR